MAASVNNGLVRLSEEEEIVLLAQLEYPGHLVAAERCNVLDAWTQKTAEYAQRWAEEAQHDDLVDTPTVSVPETIYRGVERLIALGARMETGCISEGDILAVGEPGTKGLVLALSFLGAGGLVLWLLKRYG